ncbi:MAG: hypothetical protein Q7J25_12280 [Vicinamibacterales bacterium]|nr:hypothetical protein [Vicinamibacterales bacterium]
MNVRDAPMDVHCAKCHHAWQVPLKLPMEMGRFTRVLKAATVIGCPACGADGKDVLLGNAVQKVAAKA